ncbi:MAG: polysaccharide deacetylase family protein [Anaerolineaceae bacterium]|nr:polysaccharide deacetylase family protein [Anaerolineaceae bacterium]
MTEHISRRQFLRWGGGMAMGATLPGAVPTFAHADPQQLMPGAGLQGVIRHINTRERKISLTFDDLWSEYYAFRIGREFYRRDIRVTFFPIGRAVAKNLSKPNPGYEGLYLRLRDMGHEFGCHLHTHRDISEFDLQQLIDEELEPSLEVLRIAFGSNFEPLGIRPPFGIITDPLRELSSRYQMPLIMWGLDSQDAICTKENGAEDCEEAILANYEGYMRPGTIILHHAIKASFLAIEAILDFLDDWNMAPIALSELFTYVSSAESDSG